jgi:hypothetical protein
MPALVLATALAGCGGAPTDVRQRIAWFHDHANAGRFAEISREETLPQPFDKYMQRRTALGRMIRSTEAVVDRVSYQGIQLFTVHQNTEFERGHALETFRFRRDDHGLRLSSYNYQIGKRAWCPAITMSPTQCETEDAPAPMSAAR